MDHAHVNVLGIIRSNDDFVLRRRLHLVVLAFGHGLQLGHGLVVFGDGFGHLLSGHRAVIQHGMLVVLEVLQKVKKHLRVKLTHLSDGELVAARVVRAIDAVVHQGTEVAALVQLGVHARFL